MAQDTGLRRIGNRIVIPPKDVADLLGVSRTTIYDLDGLERADAGGVYIDSLLKVYAKRQKSETPASLAEQVKEARARRAIADADKAEIERDLLTGSTVERATIESDLYGAVIAARDRLLTLSNRLAPQLAREIDPAVIIDIITNEINRTLNELVDQIEASSQVDTE